MVKSNHVLYLEDDVDDIEVLETIFAERSDYELHAYSVREYFWRHISEHLNQICLLVIDYNLPGSDGLSVLAQFREMFPELKLPAVLYTTNVQSEIADKAGDLGGVTICKPPSVDAIRRTVNVMLRFCEKE